MASQFDNSIFRCFFQSFLLCFRLVLLCSCGLRRVARESINWQPRRRNFRVRCASLLIRMSSTIECFFFLQGKTLSRSYGKTASANIQPVDVGEGVFSSPSWRAQGRALAPCCRGLKTQTFELLRNAKAERLSWLDNSEGAKHYTWKKLKR